MQLQHDVLGHSVVVPVHANCHRGDLAFRDAMDNSHEWLDVVGNTMNLVVTWYNNAPTRLWNLRRMSWAVEISPLQYSSPGRGGHIDVDARSKCSSQPSIIAVHDAGGAGGEGEKWGKGEQNFCLGHEHDSAEVREREGSEWPPDFWRIWY